jgi:hypothetical protein
VEHNLLRPNPSPILDTLYSSSLMHGKPGSITINPAHSRVPDSDAKPTVKGAEEEEGPELEEVVLLGEGDGKRISEALDMPELHQEIDRAIWQVKRDLDSKHALEEEKGGLERATGKVEEVKEEAKEMKEEVEEKKRKAEGKK